MIFVYSKGDEFCSSAFSGDRKIALANGYKEVTDEMYDKLLNNFAHWVDGELVERQKTPEEITKEEEEARKAQIDAEITTLKGYLAETDYKAIKYAEGWISEEEYADVKAKRQAWRDRINELENSEGSQNE